MFFANGTSVKEYPIVFTKWVELPTSTTVYEYGPNPIRQYFSGPELPELTEVRHQAVTVSAPSEIEAVLCAPEREWDCEEAKHVAFCESSNRPSVISKPNSNGTRDFGLMQINDGAWKQAFYNRWDKILELEMNVELAYHIWGLYGWKPWTCAP
tara:strand:+ start:1482 stop:1943 length:462 start_codon:yes stop_codon:yes gene_type:complete